MPTSRTRVRRIADRGHYDAATIHAILDEGFICHVGFVVEGQPYVIPTSYGRDGNRLILHGSIASRMAKHLGEGFDACVSVTLIDGLVLARSQFHSSMNYRSVVVLGRATPIRDEAEKRRALEILVEHLASGRGVDSRAASDQELAATEVLAFPLEEASAKIRTGPPGDNDEDLDLGMWAGVIPLGVEAGTPLDAPDLKAGIEPPGYVRRYQRGDRP
jgi:nitroimidazol reductase NimA-like FMN-containing flavoprotein (pyridoxamine 5'-phosphate oxidase superfamily)